MTPPVPIQQRSFEFAYRIVKLHEHMRENGSATARRLSDQLLDSGTSIGANLEEADAGQSKADFIAKCGIALKEARETKFWLKLLSETNQVKPTLLAPLIQESSEIVAILTTIVRKSRGQ